MIDTHGKGKDNGSSPRLRGTLALWQVQRVRIRFIPAPAGNAEKFDCAADNPAVHPRACGERAKGVFGDETVVGSSPRLRGTLIVRFRNGSLLRFIPAPAGNAATHPNTNIARSVHPRACGERAHPAAPRPSFRGSSPRLRGTQRPDVCQRICRRFIPAPAGNADETLRAGLAVAVHPRACGERRRVCGPVIAGERFIPAPAGNAQ